jgi:hypothetical protein
MMVLHAVDAILQAAGLPKTVKTGRTLLDVEFESISYMDDIDRHLT